MHLFSFVDFKHVYSKAKIFTLCLTVNKKVWCNCKKEFCSKYFFCGQIFMLWLKWALMSFNYRTYCMPPLYVLFSHKKIYILKWSCSPSLWHCFQRPLLSGTLWDQKQDEGKCYWFMLSASLGLHSSVSWPTDRLPLSMALTSVCVWHRETTTGESIKHILYIIQMCVCVCALLVWLLVIILKYTISVIFHLVGPFPTD